MKVSKKFLPTLFLGLSCLLLLFATVNYMPLLLLPQIHRLFSFLDITPPRVRIISPEEGTYFIREGMLPLKYSIHLIFSASEPPSRMTYILNSGEEIPLSGNTTLYLSFGRYNLTVRVYDLAGNAGLDTVSFTISRTFSSINDLVRYLKSDNLSDYEWKPSFTCHNFTLEFISRAESRGYYIFEYCFLYGENLTAYVDALTSIRVTKERSNMIMTWQYEMKINEDVGHAVVKLILDNSTLIIEPQTDTVFRMEEKNGKTVFTVLYAGEITEY